MKYFTGTKEQARLIAQYQLFMLGEKRCGRNDMQVMKDTAGDTAVKVLYEDKYNLVYISIDSGIDIVFAIKKGDFSKSQSIEL